MENEQLLIQKLDAFTRKFYKNRVIRGALLVVALVGFLFIVSVLLEHFFNFGKMFRTILFYLNLAVAGFALVRLVATPAMQYFRIGKILTHEQAARIIGEHFADVGDKLLNTLQLMHLRRESPEHLELILAGIDQKITALRVFRFPSMISLKKNLSYLRYAAPPLLAILILLVAAPSLIPESAGRIIRHDEVFAEKMPFSMELVNRNLKAMQQDDFTLQVKFTGEEIPAEVFIRIDGSNFRMDREKSFLFSYAWKSLRNDIRFSISAGKYTSEEFTLKIYPRPILLNFDALLDYPEYTGKQDELVENSGDLAVPEGTTVRWNIYTRDVTSVLIAFPDERVELKRGTGNLFTWSKVVANSSSYTITPFNEYVYKPDSLVYRITSIADGFPSISVSEAYDTALLSTVFFRGTIKDDYGFSKLEFTFEGKSEEDTSVTRETLLIPIEKGSSSQTFIFSKDFGSLVANPGEQLEYYFEVWDNDGLHGPKSTRSEKRLIKTPTISDLEKSTGKNEEVIKKEFEKSLEESESISKNIDELKRKMVDQKTMTWQEKKKVEEMIRANEAILEKVNEIKEKNAENIRNEERYLETGERIVEKQKRLNELMEEMLTDEMKKMMQELKNMLNDIDKEKLSDVLEKMKLTNEELEKQLDRNLEIYKQIEFDRKMEKTIDELRKTADRQEKLGEKTEEKARADEQLIEEQENLKSSFDSIEKKMDELNEQGRELSNPPDLQQTKENRENIRKKQEESSGAMKKGNRKDASKMQKDAAREMREMADKMESMQEEAEEEQLEEDISNLRMILENLVRLSFEQEELIYRTKETSRSDPRYLEVINKQKEVRERMKVIEDSITEVAKRQVEIKPVVSRELTAINQNISMTLEALDSRNPSIAASRQQFTMTSINNLALLLNEELTQMNQQSNMNMSGKGSKNCKKPSSKGGSQQIKSMRDLQKKLGEQLDKTREGIEKMKKEGKGSKQDRDALNKQIAKMAAQQEAIRTAMQKYQESLMEQGVKEVGNMGKAISEMEETERDILNKRITRETINRQERIMTRMLESEKAEEMREQEEKRESNEAKNRILSNPEGDFEYKRQRTAGSEVLKMSDPPLNFFYRNKVNEYMIKIRK
jgi:hypothetical protein